jgi:hypothetical protein
MTEKQEKLSEGHGDPTTSDQLQNLSVQAFQGLTANTSRPSSKKCTSVHILTAQTQMRASEKSGLRCDDFYET